MYYRYIPTPVGRFLLAGDAQGLVMTSFTRGYQQRKPEPDWLPDDGTLERAATQLGEYFAGNRQRFDIPLALKGTPFQREVWGVLQTIPFGETWAYGDIAARLGRPGAARAVGSANIANRLPIVVPCHRVLGKRGQLIGFGGGLDTKQWLLDFEKEPKKTRR